MKRLKDKLKKKLGSQSGESIAETLIALLISVLALIMLAGAIAASSSMITKSRKKLDTYYSAAENVATRNSGGTPFDGGITIIDNNSSNGVISPTSYNITYYTDNTFSKTPVIAYEQTVSNSNSTSSGE